jgi:hypothetical protein
LAIAYIPVGDKVVPARVKWLVKFAEGAQKTIDDIR